MGDGGYCDWFFWDMLAIAKVNTATVAEVEILPGIGPVIARRIIEGRPYRSVEELDRVKGIGKRRLEQIRPLISTG